MSDIAPTRHVGLRRQRYGVAPSSVNPKSLELFDRRSCWHPVVAQLHEKLDRGHRKFWIQVVFDRDPDERILPFRNPKEGAAGRSGLRRRSPGWSLNVVPLLLKLTLRPVPPHSRLATPHVFALQHPRSASQQGFEHSPITSTGVVGNTTYSQERFPWSGPAFHWHLLFVGNADACTPSRRCSAPSGAARACERLSTFGSAARSGESCHLVVQRKLARTAPRLRC